MCIRMLIFLEVVMTKLKDYFSKGEIVLWNDDADGDFCINIMA